MSDRARIWAMGLRALLAAGVVTAVVMLPVEISFAADPVAPPLLSVCLLLGSSCLLLVGSSLTMRREEAARRRAARQADWS